MVDPLLLHPLLPLLLMLLLLLLLLLRLHKQHLYNIAHTHSHSQGVQPRPIAVTLL